MKLKYLLIATIITCNYTMPQETTLDGIIKRLSKAFDIESDVDRLNAYDKITEELKLIPKIKHLKISGMYSGKNRYGFPTTIKIKEDGSYYIESISHEYSSSGDWIDVGGDTIEFYSKGAKVSVATVSINGLNFNVNYFLGGIFFKRIK